MLFRSPRKINRADARRAWQQTAHVRPPLPQLLVAVDQYMAWRDQLHAKRDFVPAMAYPATWLRGERWSDEFDTPTASAVVKLEVPVDPRVDAWRQAERMAVMRARAAWADVVCAARSRSLPLGGWSEPETDAALRAIGGFVAVCEAGSMKTLNEMSTRFEQAWTSPDRMGSRNVIAINARRVA